MVTIMASAMRVFDLTPREYANKMKAYTFSASEIKSNRNDIFGKFYMRVQPDMVPKFERLKIRNGSIVDIVASANYYKDKNGKYGLEWEIKDISISNIPSSIKCEETGEAFKNTESTEIQEQRETLASIMLDFTTNMFGS